MLFDPSFEPYIPRPVEYLMNVLYKANNDRLPAGLNNISFEDNPTKTILVTDFLSKIIGDDWGSGNFDDLSTITSTAYWNAYVNENQSFPIDEEGSIGEAAQVTELQFAPEYIIYLDKLTEGYTYSLLQFNSGLYFEDDANQQPFNEFPLYNSGLVYSGLDVIMYLMKKNPILPFNGPLAIDKEVITNAKSDLSKLQNEYLTLHNKQFENEFEKELDEIDRKRHEIIFKVFIDHKISVPVADPLVMDYEDDTALFRGNIYYSLSACEHSVIKELYEFWVS